MGEGEGVGTEGRCGGEGLAMIKGCSVYKGLRLVNLKVGLTFAHEYPFYHPTHPNRVDSLCKYEYQSSCYK